MKAASFFAAIVLAFLIGVEANKAGFNPGSIIDSLPIPVIETDSNPIVGSSRHFAVIYESGDKSSLPDAYRTVIDSVPLRGWLRDKGFVQDGNDTFQFLDPDQNTQYIEDKWFARALALPREALPWVVISDGTKGYAGPMPEVMDSETNAEYLERFKLFVEGVLK